VGWIRRVDGDRGVHASLAAQHHRPQIVGPFSERVARQRLECEPGAARDLVLELSRGPTGVPGEDPHLGEGLAEGVGVGREVHRADGAVDATEPTSVHGARPGPGEADRRLRLDRAALEDDGRLAGQAAPAAQHLTDGHLGGAVEDHAEGAALLVGDEQHDRAFEVRVPQSWRRHEQMPDQRLHRPPLLQSGLTCHAWVRLHCGSLPSSSHPSHHSLRPAPRLESARDGTGGYRRHWRIRALRAT
jgi:hypothetical protein